MAIYWPTPGFKGRTFKLCVLTRWDFNFCVRSSQLWGIGDRRLSQVRSCQIATLHSPASSAQTGNSAVVLTFLLSKCNSPQSCSLSVDGKISCRLGLPRVKVQVSTVLLPQVDGKFSRHLDLSLVKVQVSTVLLPQCRRENQLSS